MFLRYGLLYIFAKGGRKKKSEIYEFLCLDTSQDWYVDFCLFLRSFYLRMFMWYDVYFINVYPAFVGAARDAGNKISSIRALILIFGMLWWYRLNSCWYSWVMCGCCKKDMLIKWYSPDDGYNCNDPKAWRNWKFQLI